MDVVDNVADVVVNTVEILSMIKEIRRSPQKDQSF
jgi:hypothetical protein